MVASGALDHPCGTDEVHAGLAGHGWPHREATMVAAAVKYLVLGAATTASGDQVSGDAEGSSRDRLADMIERASFTLALDSIVCGFEPVYAEVRAVRAAG